MVRFPKLSALEWVMVSVVGIGAYAAIKLSRTSASTPQTPTQSTKPTPLTVPKGPLPDVPGPVILPTNIRFISGSPLQLRPAGWYHGRIETRGQPAPFSSSSSRATISAGLAGMGFGNVSVFMTPKEAAQDIFVPFALSGAASGTRWFRARWPVNIENPLPMPARPAALVFVWQASPPS